MLIPSRLGRAYILGLLILLSAGCGSGDTGTITGKVTYKGSPIAEGDVNIVNKAKGIGIVASIGPEGIFKVTTPLPLGAYEASVTPPAKAPPGLPGKREKEQKYADIPKKARDFKTSGLSFTIKNGVNDVSFDIKD